MATLKEKTSLILPAGTAWSSFPAGTDISLVLEPVSTTWINIKTDPSSPNAFQYADQKLFHDHPVTVGTLCVLSLATDGIQLEIVPASTSASTSASAPTTSLAQPSPEASTSPAVTPTQATTEGSQGTSTPSATPSKAPATSHVSKGAAAGIAVGGFLAGALVVGLVAWFCLRRKKNTGATRDSETSVLAFMSKEKGPAAKATSFDSGSANALAVGNGLPQPLEDKAISGEVSKISNLIKNHVRSYYHTKAVSPGMIDFGNLQALGNALPISVGTLSTLLQNLVTREIALRFCIAWVIISRLRLHSSLATTLLPPEIVECLQAISIDDRGSQAHSRSFAKWRAITSELTQSTYVRDSFSPGDSRLYNIQAAATVLENILVSYADARVDNGERSRNLEQIIKRAASFGFTLFSQPTGWDFDWQTEHGVKAGELCLFPALIQVSDEYGASIRPPRPFSEAVVRRLDE